MPDQREPDQWGRRQVEPAPTVPRQQPLDVRAVHDLPRHLDLLRHQRDGWVAVRVADPQLRVVPQQRRRRRPQRVEVQRPGQPGHELGEVDVLLALVVPRVEQQPGLQRRQRPQLHQVGPGRLQPLDVHLGQFDQREVGRGVAGGLLGMGGDRGQRAEPQLPEPGHVGLGQQVPRPGPLDDQARPGGLVLGPGVDLQQVRERHARVLALDEDGGLRRGRPVGGVPGVGDGEPAEVVELELRAVPARAGAVSGLRWRSSP